MRHPDEAVLALFAGHDLGFISEWRTRRHVVRCQRCRATVDAFGSLRPEIAALGELPSDIGWGKLAAEMTANIRLGLAAGECVGGRPSGLPAFSGFNTLLAYAGVMALVVASVWLQRPAPPLAEAIEESGRSVVAASGDGIELTENGRGMGLRYGAFRDVSYSADASGAMGARYVDTSTGYVTVVNVNVE